MEKETFMTDSFPASPFPGHVFVANDGSGAIVGDDIKETDWVVVLQRDKTIRGPRPAMCYKFRHLGGPSDVIAFHIHETPSEAEQRRYKDEDDAVRPAGSGPRKPGDAGRKQRRPDDVFGAVIEGIGLIGALGTLAAAAFVALDGDEE